MEREIRGREKSRWKRESESVRGREEGKENYTERQKLKMENSIFRYL